MDTEGETGLSDAFAGPAPTRSLHEEPIAIVGMACRFPGASSIPEFWRLLEEGGNSILESTPGTGIRRVDELFSNNPNPGDACRFCAYVDGIEQFDAGFFRISPAEAQLLDPQQRMMLETSWQALEDAGMDPGRLKGSRTGVYTGISNDEYRMLVLESSIPPEAASSLYALSGTNLNGTSGRVSFVLGLMGPSKAVDAACASSLVTVHDAVSDLQQGKADLAIVGGVQAILNGRVFELRAASMMLSPDGQCKAFDASANGYVRGEGCGVVVLKRLSDAEVDGDPIWAVVRGSAVNHGGAGTGLTVPHTPALEQVIETALSHAGVRAADVDYLEAHGTGTAVGDPIELNAVSAVYGTEREPARPLLVGSVKTNIGHLESAAGIAGLIKAVLVLQRGVIPSHLHFRNPNPDLDWDRLPLQITSSMMDLPQRDSRPRLAGVNSFGITGTNAHVVVEEYRSSGRPPYRQDQVSGPARAVGAVLPADLSSLSSPAIGLQRRQVRLLPLSGKSEPALHELVQRYQAWLGRRHAEASSEEEIFSLLSDMAWTAGVGRSHFDYRAGIVFSDLDSLQEQLGMLDGSARGARPQTAARVAFMYTGQGSQWTGMGEALYEREPVVRAVFDRCEAAFRAVRECSLLDVMFGRAGSSGKLGDTAWEQPALYTLECAITALWRSVGVRPEVVMGHSVGELAAAQAAGIFSLEDGLRFAATRGTLLSETKPGAMAAVFASSAQVAAALESRNASSGDEALTISADNGAHQVVSGPGPGIESLLEHFASEGIRTRRLNTTRAFHSALVEPALEALESSLDGVKIEPPSITLVSNLTGEAVESGRILDGAYWRRHAREAVSFARSIGTMAELGVDLVVEVGPRQVLATMAGSAWPESVQAPMMLSSLSPVDDTSASAPGGDFMQAVARAYQAGLPVRFEGLFAGESRRRVSLPGYPFQREQHWLSGTKRRRQDAGHSLLGIRHESAGGHVTFETEVYPSDPEWMSDHRVFGRVIAPGALYGAMAASAALAESGGSAAVEDIQLHNALVFAEKNPEQDGDETGRKIQVVIDSGEQENARRLRIFSRGSEEAWTLHVEGRIPLDPPAPGIGGRADLENLKAELAPVDVASYYRARADTGIELGPFFQTLGKLWSRPGEALGEVTLPKALDGNGLDVHPILLDGCFQVVAAARNRAGVETGVTYLPFGWERLRLAERLPEKVVCHVRMHEASGVDGAEAGSVPEVFSGELRIYDPKGNQLGELSGYTVKRATREALLSAVEGVEDLLYEIVWRQSALEPGILPADFLPSPDSVASSSGLLGEYLAQEGVRREDRGGLLADLELWSRSRALVTLEKLGWQYTAGETVDPEALRKRLQVGEEHKRLFRRLLEMLARSGVLEETDDGFLVKTGPEDPLPEHLSRDISEFPDRLSGLYPHGLTEIGLFRRSGDALVDVLLGRADPLTVLFSSGDPTPADLYRKTPVARAANRILKETIQALVAPLPDGRRLRVIEVGAGTGSATAAILPELPAGRFDYTYTDISAGFFAEAEAQFGDEGGSIAYRPLDIEKDPMDQGFDLHGYDLVIASNVLHATRYLQDTLAHCRKLLAPLGQLVALENLSGQGWMDLTFGQLDGWWRFADDYRPHHALARPGVWRRVLGDVGFGEVAILGIDESDATEFPDKGVIVARGPEKVTEPPGVWLLVQDDGGMAISLAADLAARNQSVVLVGSGASEGGGQPGAGAGLTRMNVDLGSRESWRSLVESLPPDTPFMGVVHLLGLDGHGTKASTEEVADSVVRAGKGALALVQGVIDADAVPEKGLWFVTSGAQVLERERGGELTGAALWGFGKAVSREAPHLQPRMIDLDPNSAASLPDLVNELMYPDIENHIAYRLGRRQVARLVREAGVERLDFPGNTDWVIAPDPDGDFERPCIKLLPQEALEPREVRIAVEASGLNFWDVFRSLGFIEEGNLGREMCGHVVDAGTDVSGVSVGDRVVGLGFGAFAAEMVTREELVAHAPPGFSATDLATVPSAFVSAALSYEFSGLEAGDRVLIHAGAGGVGLAAIQIAQAAGAEVFATASEPKQAYLRARGVEHVFDSRQNGFGKEILSTTNGQGVDIVLNSLTGEGFIDASLSCLKQGGRFVELARRDILTEAEMTAVRPDVAYAILELDVLKKTDPGSVGRVLRDVIKRLSTGELEPIVHSRWPLAEAGAALRFMRSARHLGKIVVTSPPLVGDRLRQDRTYLVTGGLGGIGCAVAAWLADKGAGAIVLNGRRPPDADAEEVIRSLGERGARVQVELADVKDAVAVNGLMERLDRDLPPLGGVIHSVGVLSDGALTNQSWERFEEVLWPKILGAWNLHRATLDRDLDMFILFSSRVGVMGNPGQANHAAANAFLDQLAGHRRALGLPGQAIAWGAWSEIGEAAEQRERIERQRAALGGRWFTPQQGIKALDRLVRQDVPNSVVMSMDWSVFEEAVEDRPPLLEDLLSAVVDTGAGASALADSLLERLQQTPATEREDLLVSFLQQELQAVLRLSGAPEPTVGFFDLGMDSLMAVELRNRLNRAFADVYTASNTMVFDYPDITTLARHLVTELGDIEAVPILQESPELQRRPVSGSQEEAIAIVGMACRFPGAPDLTAFWRQLEAGEDAVTEGRQDAGPWKGVAGDPGSEDAVYRQGGFVSGLDLFDADFFSIRPIEARMMDPRQRLLLETSWRALEDAGIDPALLKGSRSGIYVGLGGGSEYRDLIAANGQDGSYLGTAGSVAVGRIAFMLGLMGPAVPLDMTCASSLVAVHQASAALRQGEVDMCLVGGVHAVLSPTVTRFMLEYGMLSANGRCRTFDASADGFVRGEGCGMVVLKRLGDAEAAGDRIWGVIRGSAVNQNGVSASLTVPSGTAQERVMEEALFRAGILPAEVDFLEAHATGSKLGDPIEVRAAAQVYGSGRDPDQPLWLGTVKTNIGHLEPAAGIAGLIKVVLAMKQRVIPGHLHFDSPNPNMDWDGIPVRVASEAEPWPLFPDRPPRAGVSAFALSGSNAHCVVEGYGAPADGLAGFDSWIAPAGSALPVTVSLPEPFGSLPMEEEVSPRPTRLLPLSGKSGDALRDLAGEYLSWLAGHAESLDDAGRAGSLLSDMAWTAAVGRSHFSHRAGIVFNDAASLKENLERIAQSRRCPLTQAPRKVAFAFPGLLNDDTGIGEGIYNSEPAARAVLDRCETAFRAERGGSLLDILFARSEEPDPASAQSAAYALECALAALWLGIGMQPGIVTGAGPGEIAAAQMAGAIGLEDGLRVAARYGLMMESASGDAASAFDGIDIGSPSLTLVNAATGQAVQAGESLDRNWFRPGHEAETFGQCLKTLASLGAEVAVEVGAALAVAKAAETGGLAVVPGPKEVSGTAMQGAGAFVEAVAKAYEAGFPVQFAGLFTGERRSRISLPGYPFQRSRFWFSD